MRTRRRPLAIAGTASAALHAATLLAMAWVPQIRWPEPPIAVEVRAPHRVTPKVAPPAAGLPGSEETRPQPPAPRAAATRKPAKKGPGPAVAKPAPLPPPPSTADLRPFAPGDAKIVILLRTDRLRKSPYKDSVQALLEALPDYRTLLAGTGLSPLDDFDALLIATANPFDVTATFLAARHRADPRIHKALAQRIMPTWDPRTIRYLTPTLSVLTRPDGAGRIDAVAAPGYPLPAPPVPSPSGADGGVDETARWLDDLARFDRIAGEDGGPSMMVTVSDLASLLHLQQGLPTPLDGSLAATADPNPALRLRMTFTDEGEATLFEAEWPAIVKRWRASALLLGLGGMLDGLTVKREGVVLEVSGRIAGTQVALALSWAKALLPRAREAAATDDPADGGTLQTDGAKAPVDSGGG